MRAAILAVVFAAACSEQPFTNAEMQPVSTNDAGGDGDGDAPKDAGPVDEPRDSGAVAADAATDSGADSPCSPACSGATPICDAELGECKPIEVLAIYTEYEENGDLAHRSYARDANDWFPGVAEANGFSYEATSDWERLKSAEPRKGRVLIFLDDKPREASQRAAFEAYMQNGGAWIGCHFAAYTPGASEWDWYFNDFLGTGDYGGNTWRPTSATLAVEKPEHPLAQGLGATFSSSPNEWYRFRKNPRTQSNIEVLLSIDPVSFPLGTGPIATEIWHEGDYPVVWTNTDYRMLYVNMGHDDMDYGGTNQPLSHTFDTPIQNQMLLNAIRWLGGAAP